MTRGTCASASLLALKCAHVPSRPLHARLTSTGASRRRRSARRAAPPRCPSCQRAGRGASTPCCRAPSPRRAPCERAGEMVVMRWRQWMVRRRRGSGSGALPRRSIQGRGAQRGARARLGDTELPLWGARLGDVWARARMRMGPGGGSEGGRGGTHPRRLARGKEGEAGRGWRGATRSCDSVGGASAGGLARLRSRDPRGGPGGRGGAVLGEACAREQQQAEAEADA